MYPRSRKLYPFGEIYSFKEHPFKLKAICSFMASIFNEHFCVRAHSSNIYSKIAPSHFMIIISFTITISRIKYSYNSFRLKDEEIADMIVGSVLYLLFVSLLLPSFEEMSPESLPASHTISSPIGLNELFS